EVPTVIGWMRPVILLPVAAVAALTPAQVEAILAHELSHIRRHDYAVNLLQTIAETLLFYHPAVWWVSKRIRAEREHCCDDVAVRVCGDAVSYAHALAELESWRVTSTVMAVAATDGSLLARVRRILREPVSDEARTANGAATLVLTLIFTAGAGAVQQLPSLIGLPGNPRAAASSNSARPATQALARMSLGPTHGSAPTGATKGASARTVVAGSADQYQPQQSVALSERALQLREAERMERLLREAKRVEESEVSQPPVPPLPPGPPEPPHP